MRPKQGRRPRPQGSGSAHARRMSLNLDSQSEAALAVLRTLWGARRSPMASATAIKRALIEHAANVAPKAYAESLAEVRERRERDAA